MTARLLDLAAAILARLGILRRPAAGVAPLAVPSASPCPPGPRVTRHASLLGVPGCNREGGAP